MTPRLPVAVLLLVVVVALAVASPAAASTRRLCARSAALRDSPGGFVIGRLYRPQRLRYMRRSANRRWALVRTRSSVAGWMPYRSLCRA
jgi:hypothetical protein